MTPATTDASLPANDHDHFAGAVQVKEFYFCLVDEADSILIDEARTPLIISQSVDAPAQKFATAQKIATVLEKGVHYTVRYCRRYTVQYDGVDEVLPSVYSTVP